MFARLKSLLGNRNPLRLAWHKGKAFLAALRYGFPAKKLIVIGITGTDGKTTTVGMVAHILQNAGFKTGALSTAFFQVGNEVTWNPTQKTSPSPFTIQRFLRKLVDAGCTHAVLEYSSHGLVQGRMNYTWPRVAGITNTSAEHLDYHGSMEQYRRDKGILFQMLRPDCTKVLNADDETLEMYRAIPTERAFVYSVEELGIGNLELGNSEMMLWLSEQSVDGFGIKATVHCVSEESSKSEERSPLSLRIPGSFNLANALCAIGSAMSCGTSLQDATKALADFPGIPGRMERIDEGQPFDVYIDFTVTPASYESTLSTLKKMLSPGKRLLALTGSCGDRMREKRPQVGKIVSSYADVMVVANEDPYTEDPERIIDEVWAGIDQSKTKAHRIFDRKEAIGFLLNEATPGDIVILCGKGSDTTMWVKKGQVPWNEREITRELLQKKGG